MEIGDVCDKYEVCGPGPKAEISLDLISVTRHQNVCVDKTPSWVQQLFAIIGQNFFFPHNFFLGEDGGVNDDYGDATEDDDDEDLRHSEEGEGEGVGLLVEDLLSLSRCGQSW